jgi:DNA-binding XRE family transcriptional regulator
MSTHKLTAPTAQEVAQLRADAGLSTHDFAQLVYASVASVQAWEAGRRQCPLPSWELLQVYFGKAPARVLGARTSRKQAQAAQHDIARAIDGLRAFNKALEVFALTHKGGPNESNAPSATRGKA